MSNVAIMNANLLQSTRPKTLLYIASGSFQNHYTLLPYQLIILVDRCLPTRVTLVDKGQLTVCWKGHASGNYLTTYLRNHLTKNVKPLKADQKIILELGMDALDGIKLLHELDITIDALVNINEGLYEGNGDYAIFLGMVIGYIIPLFADNLILVCDPEYYSYLFRKMFTRPTLWGFTKMEIRLGDVGYIHAEQFTVNNVFENRGKVFILTRNLACRRYNFHKFHLMLIKDSIWSDHHVLDLMVHPLRMMSKDRRSEYHSTVVTKFFINQPKVCTLDYSNIYDLISLASYWDSKIIGLIAHTFFDDIENLKALRNQSFADRVIFSEIRFYCLTDSEYELGLKALSKLASYEH